MRNSGNDMIFQRRRELLVTNQEPVFLSYLKNEIRNSTNSSFIVKL